MAIVHGSAIGIGHPYPETAAGLVLHLLQVGLLALTANLSFYCDCVYDVC